MTKFQFTTAERPKAIAKKMRKLLEDKGVEIGQAKVLDIVASLYGHESWHALCGALGPEASPDDSRCDGATVAKRRALHVAVLARAFPGLTGVEDIVERLHPTSAAPLVQRGPSPGMIDWLPYGCAPEQVPAIRRLFRTNILVILSRGNDATSFNGFLEDCLRRMAEDGVMPMTADIGRGVAIDPVKQPNVFPIMDPAKAMEAGVGMLATFKSMRMLRAQTMLLPAVKEPELLKDALRASMSGMQVWLNIDGKSALDVLAELSGAAGMEPKNVDLVLDNVRIVHQVALDALCPSCSRSPEGLDGEGGEIARLLSKHAGAHVRIRSRVGCASCRDLPGRPGVVGSVTCTEVFEGNRDAFRRLVAGDLKSAKASWLSAKGTITAFEHALRHVAEGIVDPRDLAGEAFDRDDIERLAADAGRLAGVVSGDWSRYTPVAPRDPMSHDESRRVFEEALGFAIDAVVKEHRDSARMEVPRWGAVDVQAASYSGDLSLPLPDVLAKLLGDGVVPNGRYILRRGWSPSHDILLKEVAVKWEDALDRILLEVAYTPEGERMRVREAASKRARARRSSDGRPVPPMDDIMNALRKVRRTCWMPVKSDKPSVVQGTRYYGSPWLPDGMAWPEHDGEPDAFVMQVNPSELPDEVRNAFGDDRLLLYFQGQDGLPQRSASFLRVDPSLPGTVRSSPEGMRTVPETPIVYVERDDYPGDISEDFRTLSRLGEAKSLRTLLEIPFDCGSGRRMVGHAARVTEDDVTEQALHASEVMGVEVSKTDARLLAGVHCRNGDKLAGWPSWEQGPQWPKRKGSKPMPLLMQFDAEDPMHAKSGVLYGIGHLFLDPAEPERHKFVWNCD